MALLTTAERDDLARTLTGALAPYSLTLVRVDSDGNETARPAQDVVYALARLQPRQSGSGSGAVETLAMVTFYRLAPFDVVVGDRFALDGRSGIIHRVFTDPALGVIVAEGQFDVGTV